MPVIEAALREGRWQVVRPSRYARRYTTRTPFAVGGPAPGHALMKTAADPDGRTVLGTLNNCGSGLTPWGTYLSGEENWAFYFDGPDTRDVDQARWGLLSTGLSRWGAYDPRFDAKLHPNEFHRFGWVVEIDPYDPASVPVKRTAFGRGAHEGAWVATTRDGRAVYCTLTNNSRRGMPNRPGVDAANPRANNTMGHIIQWTEDGDFDSTTIRWKHLLLAGDPANERPEARGNVRGDVFACPDGLALDARGVLWIQTDMAPMRCTGARCRASATTRCWPAIPPLARCGAS